MPATLLAMVIDAAVHAIFGNTPGRALLGLHVTDEDADDIGFWKYLGRNMMVLVFGLMFAIPPLSLLLPLVQAGVVIKKGRATYDFQMRTTVSLAHPGPKAPFLASQGQTPRRTMSLPSHPPYQALGETQLPIFSF